MSTSSRVTLQRYQNFRNHQTENSGTCKNIFSVRISPSSRSVSFGDEIRTENKCPLGGRSEEPKRSVGRKSWGAVGKPEGLTDGRRAEERDLNLVYHKISDMQVSTKNFHFGQLFLLQTDNHKTQYSTIHIDTNNQGFILENSQIIYFNKMRDFPIFLSTFVSTFEVAQMPFNRKKSSLIPSYFTLIQTLTYK